MATTQVGVYQNRGQLSAQSFQQLRLHQQRELAGQDTPGLRERLKSNSLQVSTNIKIDAAVKVEISSEARELEKALELRTGPTILPPTPPAPGPGPESIAFAGSYQIESTDGGPSGTIYDERGRAAGRFETAEGGQVRFEYSDETGSYSGFFVDKDSVVIKNEDTGKIFEADLKANGTNFAISGYESAPGFAELGEDPVLQGKLEDIGGGYRRAQVGENIFAYLSDKGDFQLRYESEKEIYNIATGVYGDGNLYATGNTVAVGKSAYEIKDGIFSLYAPEILSSTSPQNKPDIKPVEPVQPPNYRDPLNGITDFRGSFTDDGRILALNGAELGSYEFTAGGQISFTLKNEYGEEVSGLIIAPGEAIVQTPDGSRLARLSLDFNGNNFSVTDSSPLAAGDQDKKLEQSLTGKVNEDGTIQVGDLTVKIGDDNKVLITRTGEDGETTYVGEGFIDAAGNLVVSGQGQVTVHSRLERDGDEARFYGLELLAGGGGGNRIEPRPTDETDPGRIGRTRPEPRSDDIEPAPADRTHEDDELEDLRKIATKRLNKLIRKALKAYRQGGQFEDHPNSRELGGQRSDDALYEATQVLLAQIQRG